MKCKSIKFAFAALLVVAIVLAIFDLKMSELVLLKTAEGVLGGLLFGLVAGLDLWVRLHHRRGFTLWRFRCVLWREVRVGMCAGCLVGMALSVVAILVQ